MNSNFIKNFNYFDVDENVKNYVEKLVQSNNYKLMTIIRESNHKLDDYLYLVIAFNEDDKLDGFKYVCWFFNGRGLDNGIYRDTFKEIMYVMLERINDIKYSNIANKLSNQKFESIVFDPDRKKYNFSIKRTINGLPEVITLTAGEIYQLNFYKYTTEGYDIIENYIENNFKNNKEDKIKERKLLKMQMDKDICSSISSDFIEKIEENYMYDNEELSYGTVDKYLKEFVIPVDDFVNNLNEEILMNIFKNKINTLHSDKQISDELYNNILNNQDLQEKIVKNVLDYIKEDRYYFKDNLETIKEENEEFYIDDENYNFFKALEDYDTPWLHIILEDMKMK